jgi:mannose PTS system EIIA component
MIKGLIGNLGKELVAVAEGILEQKVEIDCVSFDWREDGTGAIRRVENFLGQNQDDNIIIFTDMFGGSPTNVCYKFNRVNIEIITGVNLPGLLKFLTYKDREMPFKEFVKLIKKEAIEGINIISEFLGEKKK